MPQIQITTTFEISDQFVRDVLCTAIEGGSNYWAQFENARTVQGNYVAEVSELDVCEYGDESTEQSRHRIDTDKIREGMRRLLARDFNIEASHGHAAQRYTWTLQRTILENDAGMIDADDADVILQLACFGHIIYG